VGRGDGGDSVNACGWAPIHVSFELISSEPVQRGKMQ
jgi:hypothetical protein